MIILDTNVLSAFMSSAPDERVVEWLDEQPSTSVWTSSVTVFEIEYGLRILPPGRRRTSLVQAFENLLLHKLSGRIAPFDSAAASEAAKVMADRKRKGRPGDLRDTMIAGIAVACRATLATRNAVHFADVSVPVVNPWVQTR